MKFISTIFISTLFLFSCNEKVEKQELKTDSTPTVQAEMKNTPAGFLEDLLSIKSESELKEKFGAGRISNDTIWGEQGAYVIGSFVDAHTKNEVQIMWKDFPKCTSVSEVIIESYSSPLKEEAFANEWKSKTGIRLGMTSGELEKLNGKPFLVEYFNESVRGEISSWQDGNINRKTTHVDLSAAGKMNGLSQKEMDELFKHYNIPSDNKVMQKVQPWVVKIAIYK